MLKLSSVVKVYNIWSHRSGNSHPKKLTKCECLFKEYLNIYFISSYDESKAGG